MNETSQPDLPDFSVVLETANLNIADLTDLQRALASLAMQENPSMPEAREVIVVDSGIVATEAIEQACAPYEWATVMRVPPDTNYYGAKIAGLQQTTGEVVVFADADCQYLPGWLAGLLSVFAANPDAQFVSGETSFRVNNPYDLALALTGVFVGFSSESEPVEDFGYHPNNFACRRDVLSSHPFPVVPNAYRAAVSQHSYNMRQAGIILWRQPASRCFHRSTSPSIFLRRFILQGSDSLAMDDPGSSPVDWQHPWQRRWQFFGMRLKGRLSESARNWFFLPFALPFVALAVVCYSIGLLIGRFRPELVPLIARGM